jgi:hypothetical protein
MTAGPEGFGDRPVPVRPLYGEQAQLLEILRAARGEPVTFAELRERGIENPATLCYELEIAGLPITHVERPQLGGMPAPVGVQLDEAWLAAPDVPEPQRTRELWPARGTQAVRWVQELVLTGAALLAVGVREAASWIAGRRSQRSARASVRDTRARRSGGRLGRWAPARAKALRVAGNAGAAVRASARGVGDELRAHVQPRSLSLRYSTRTWALLVALTLVGVSALAIMLATRSSGTSGGFAAGRHRSAHARSSQLGAGRAAARAHNPASAQAAGAAGGGESPGSHAQPHTGEGPANAARLQSEGHQLLAEGHYAAAASDLRSAITASGGSTAHCAEPTSEACLTYAYALYDLGRALQLQHNPGAAVPILNERLRIDNQRSTVRAELHAAREQLHPPAAPPSSKHGAHVRSHHSARAPQTTRHQQSEPSEEGSGAPAHNEKQERTEVQGRTREEPSGGGNTTSAPGGGAAAPGGGTPG